MYAEGVNMNEIIRPVEDAEYRAAQIKKIETQFAEAAIKNQQRKKAESDLGELRDQIIAGERLLNFEFFSNGGSAPFVTIAVTNGLRHSPNDQCCWRVFLFPYDENTPMGELAETVISTGMPLSEQCGRGFYPMSSGNQYAAQDVDY